VRVRRQHGFTYIGLLVAVAVLGLLLTLAARVWSTTEQREREAQLLFVGHAYRHAIGSYFASGHHFPQTLEELLVDERTPLARHHLRRLYPDPMTGQADWTLILTADGTGIMGVASSSKAAPIKRRNFSFDDRAFVDAECVCLWQFTYSPNRFTPATGPTASGNSALTPANTQSHTQPSGQFGTFTPGTISAPSRGVGGSPSVNRPLAPGGASGQTPDENNSGSN